MLRTKTSLKTMPRRRLGVVAVLALAASGCYALAGCARATDGGIEASSNLNAKSQLVISQVYGGGGNRGGEAGPAPLSHDFVELFNRGQEPVELDGKAILYAPASGQFSRRNVTPLKGKALQPGEHFLVQMASAIRDAGPAARSFEADFVPDGGAALSFASTKGVVALTASADACTAAPEAAAEGNGAACELLDLVGYGSERAEGNPTPALDAQTAAHRNGGGCIDTDDNAADFSTGAPAPKNRAAGATPCKRTSNEDAGEPTPQKDAGPADDAGEPTPQKDAGPADDGGAPPAEDAGTTTETDASTVGATGTQGPPGEQGPAGPAGAAGAAGAKGDKGENGSAGLDGEPGAAGEPGPAGPAGKAGPAGPAGSGGCSAAPSTSSSSMSRFAGIALAVLAVGRRKRRAD